MAARRGLKHVSVAGLANVAAMETAFASAIAGLAGGALPEALEVNLQELTSGSVESVALMTAIAPYRDVQSMTSAVVKCVTTSGHASLTALDAALDAVIVAQEGAGRTLRDKKLVRVRLGGTPQDVYVLLFTDGTLTGGLSGAPTGTMVYKGNWDIATDYVQHDVVSHNDAFFIALRATTGDEPGMSMLDWKILEPTIAIFGGEATLVGGTVTLANGVGGVSLYLHPQSKIMINRNTPGGTIGDLSCPSASRNTVTHSFVINSDDPADTSTVDWTVIS